MAVHLKLSERSAWVNLCAIHPTGLPGAGKLWSDT